jgi:hypothetical protein
MVSFLLAFRNKLIFYSEELLAPRPTPKLEDHPLSAVRDCLCQSLHFNTKHLALNKSLSWRRIDLEEM